jgi:hypothetical protein
MEKITITILYGSSCVGKSTLMNRKNSNLVKVEMDDCAFWKLDKSHWPDCCFSYLLQEISVNSQRQDMIVTCGGLPLPNHPKYSEIENENQVSFIHTLVLTASNDDYIKNIIERGLSKKKDELVIDYKWRKSTIGLYDNIIINRR